GVRPKKIGVSATGGSAVVYSYDNPTNTAGDMQYVTYTYDFVATNTMQQIQFTSQENNAFGPVLDNVSISLVPEPATWGLMIAGFGLVGGMARRRARATITTA